MKLVKQTLIELLETFGYPVSLQGSYEEGSKLPKSFFTFWNYETNLKFVDNDIQATEYVYRVYFYSKDPMLTNSVLINTRKLLMNNNFHCTGDYDIDSGEAKYTAREMEVRYLQINKIEEEQ